VERGLVGLVTAGLFILARCFLQFGKEISKNTITVNLLGFTHQVLIDIFGEIPYKFSQGPVKIKAYGLYGIHDPNDNQFCWDANVYTLHAA
jgi:hypothetical protein